MLVKRLTEETKKQIVKELKRGDTSASIAARHGTTPNTVNVIARKNNLSRRKGPAGHKETTEELCERWDRTMRAIRKKYGPE